MAKVKFNVSGTDPHDNTGKIFEDPIPGVYKAKIQACNHGFSKDQDSGKPDKSRPRLEVIYEITDGKDGGKFKGSRIWDYVVFTEASEWRLDQFLQAVGVTNTQVREGEFDTDDIVDMPVRIRVQAEKGTSVANGDYRPRIGTVMMGEDSDLDDDESLGELEVVDDEEIDGEEETEEVSADSEGYTEESLADLKITELGKILTDEFEVDRADVPKGKDPKIAMILEKQSEAGGESEDEPEEAEEAEGEVEDDLEQLGEDADGEDEEAQGRLEELAEENDLDPNDYPTWAELAEELAGMIGEDEGTNARAELEAMKIADLRAKAKELELDSTGPKAKVIDRILQEIEGDPF